MFCKKCGEKLPDNSMFCSSCGTNCGGQQKTNYYQPNGQSNSSARDSTQQYYSPGSTNIDAEIARLPDRLRPLGMWSYFGYTILFYIPIIGIIMLFVCSFGSTTNINLRNYARSFFCIYIVMIVFFFFLGSSLGAFFSFF